MRGPSGFKYLALALFFSLSVGVTYVLYFTFGMSSPFCVTDFDTVKFANVISNIDGMERRLEYDSEGPYNHAYRKIASQSETYIAPGIHGPFRVTDGDIRGTVAHTKEVAQAKLDVDLAWPVDVKCVRVWNRDDEFKNRIVPFRIYLSEVPLGEFDMEKSAHVATLWKNFTDVQTMYMWQLDKSVRVRYVRIQTLGVQFINLHEVEVFDQNIPDNYIFKPQFVQYKITPPLVPLPTTLSSLLSISGSILNLDTPATRAFDDEGNEIMESKYDQFVRGSGIQNIHISKGEGFIGDVKVCVVFLCTDGQGYNTNADYLSEVFSNIEILSANVFTLQVYDVIIFYSWLPENINTNKQRFSVAFPYVKIRFVDVSRHFPATLPQHLIDNKVNMSLYEQGSDCAPGNHWKLNYLHMGRFWSTQLWKEPILKDYDLIWRLDADATVDGPIPRGHNFLREMWSKNKVFGYWCRFHDTAECDDGVEEAAEEFAQKKGLKFKHKEKISKNTAYWGGFGVYATKFFCHNNDWLEYVDYLDSKGGHYNHRWGEQNVFPASLSLFLEFNELYWVRDTHMKLFHDHWAMDNCAGVQGQDLKDVE